MINARFTSDFVIFLDVNSFEIYAHNAHGKPYIVAMHSDYENKINARHYHRHIVQSFKRATVYIKRAWTSQLPPTVTCVLADAFTHTVFHQVTHSFDNEKRFDGKNFERALFSDVRKRAWNELERHTPIDTTDHGFMDVAVYNLEVNGYPVQLPITQGFRAKEYSFLYGASIISRKTYKAIREHAERSNVILHTVSSLSLQALRNFNAPAFAKGQALLVMGDTVSSVLTVHKNTIHMQSVSVGLMQVINNLSSSAQSWMMIAARHGIAKRLDAVFTRPLALGVRKAFAAHDDILKRLLDIATLERLSIITPIALDVQSVVVEALQGVLYPHARRYSALRESSRIIHRSHIMHL